MSDPDRYYPADEDRAGYEMPDPRPGEDDTDNGVCECCGGPPGCGCELSDVSGDDPETGPWADVVCDKHRGWV